MGTTLTVRRGDCLAAIAEEHGLAPDTIWDHPDNAALREARHDPNVLMPGDRIVVPELRVRSIACAVDRKHVFRRRGVPAWFSLQLRREGRPRAGLAYVLEVEGESFTGRTDAEGWLGHWVPTGSRRGRLVVEEVETYVLRISELVPAESQDGVRSRLINLGFLHPTRADDLESALRRFQETHGLEVTGAPDAPTRRKLVEVHGK